MPATRTTACGELLTGREVDAADVCVAHEFSWLCPPNCGWQCGDEGQLGHICDTQMGDADAVISRGSYTIGR